MLNIEKNVAVSQSSGGDQEVKIKTLVKLSEAGIFRGGMGGGIITSEFSYGKINGKRSATTTFPATGSVMATDDEGQSSYIGLGLGILSNFGISVTQATYKNDLSLQQNTTDGNIIYNTNNQNLTYLSIRPGVTFKIFGIDLGIYYDSLNRTGTSYKSTHTANANPSDKREQSLTTFPKTTTTGLGLAYSGASAHFEIGMENASTPAEASINSFPITRTRMHGIIEYKFSFITLGYKSSIYTNNFHDLDQIIPAKMMYETTGREFTTSTNTPYRVDNNFNFSFGTKQGLALGGGITYSQTSGTEQTNFGLQPQPVTTKSMGASIKLSYVF